MIWVINGFFVWLPLARPESEFPGETDTAAGILAFLGTTTFEIGSVLMVVEAINAERWLPPFLCFFFLLFLPLDKKRPCATLCTLTSPVPTAYSVAVDGLTHSAREGRSVLN